MKYLIKRIADDPVQFEIWQDEEKIAACPYEAAAEKIVKALQAAEAKPCPHCGMGLIVDENGDYLHAASDCFNNGVVLQGPRDLERWNSRDTP